jgi:hypothetical protein
VECFKSFRCLCLNWDNSRRRDDHDPVVQCPNRAFAYGTYSTGFQVIIYGRFWVFTEAIDGDGGPATSAELVTPSSVAMDAGGNLYIAGLGAGSIRKVSNGIITTVAGGGSSLGDGGPATSAQLLTRAGLAVDAAGNLYIADQLNERIRKVSNGVITTIAGGGSSFGDGGPATSAQLYSPEGMAVDSAGNVYFTDGSSRVRVLTPTATSCSYSVSPTSLQSAVVGGNLTIDLTTIAGCTWTVTNLPEWVTVSGSDTGLGSATITLVVSPNPGSPRSAQIFVAGNAVTIYQASSVLLINTGGVVSAASYTTPVAPGSLTAIFGNFLLPAPVEVSAFPIPTNLGGLSFQFGDGTLAPLFYANVGQVNAQVPWELAGQSQTAITAAINGQTSAQFSINS